MSQPSFDPSDPRMDVPMEFTPGMPEDLREMFRRAYRFGYVQGHAAGREVQLQRPSPFLRLANVGVPLTWGIWTGLVLEALFGDRSIWVVVCCWVVVLASGLVGLGALFRGKGRSLIRGKDDR